MGEKNGGNELEIPTALDKEMWCLVALPIR